jgi:hypothetical protein
MYYVKFTKSGIGLWQVSTLGFSLDGEDLVNQAQCPILAVPLPSYNYHGRAAAMEPLDDPDVPEFPPAFTNMPKECRYLIYFEGLFFKSWITFAVSFGDCQKRGNTFLMLLPDLEKYNIF